MKVKFKLCVSAISIGLALGSLSTFAAPLPQGPSNVSGATIDTQGNVMNVNQTTQFAKMDWNSFDIAAGNAVNFNQQSNYTAVNRVTGGNASQINGTLTAGGNVIIINPNGVNIGGSADIHATGFGAIAASVDDEEFKQWNGTGSLSLRGSADVIIDKGAMINATDVMIGGLNVTNNGNIYTTGRTNIHGLRDLRLKLDNGIELSGQLSVPANSSVGRVINNGEIQTQGNIDISASNTIENTGVISADGDVGIHNKLAVGTGHGLKNTGQISAGKAIKIDVYSEKNDALYNSGSIYGISVGHATSSYISGTVTDKSRDSSYGIYNEGDIIFSDSYSASSVSGNNGIYNSGRLEATYVKANSSKTHEYTFYNDGVVKAGSLDVTNNGYDTKHADSSTTLYNNGLIQAGELSVYTSGGHDHGSTATYGLYNDIDGHIQVATKLNTHFVAESKDQISYGIYNKGEIFAREIVTEMYTRNLPHERVNSYSIFNDQSGSITSNVTRADAIYNDGHLSVSNALYNNTLDEGPDSSVYYKNKYPY